MLVIIFPVTVSFLSFISYPCLSTSRISQNLMGEFKQLIFVHQPINICPPTHPVNFPDWRTSSLSTEVAGRGNSENERRGGGRRRRNRGGKRKRMFSLRGLRMTWRESELKKRRFQIPPSWGSSLPRQRLSCCTLPSPWRMGRRSSPPMSTLVSFHWGNRGRNCWGLGHLSAGMIIDICAGPKLGC